MKKVVELSLNIVIHLKVDGDGTSSALEYVGRWCWAEGPSIKDVGNSEGGGVKFHWHLPRGRSKKLPTWGRGVSKNLENMSFMDNMEDDELRRGREEIIDKQGHKAPRGITVVILLQDVFYIQGERFCNESIYWSFS